MTIEKVKEQISNHIGDEAIIKCNLGRNKFEEYSGKIKESYNHIFLVEIKSDSKTILKSFTYSDVITKIVKINY